LAVAFVLISAESGVEAEALQQLESIDQVTEAHVVYGIYDILVKVEASNLQEVKEVIARQIRFLDHIEGTMTLLVAESPQIPEITVPMPLIS
jgi:DNA-binding Lrp family transcriptional regulator